MSRPFVHLHVHTEFSLADGIVRTDDLVKTAVRHGMPAVAVTDLSNLFGVVKFYQAACAAGLKPIVGSDVWLENPADPHKPYRLVLLCRDNAGYRLMCRLLTRAYVDGQHSGKPCLSKSWFEAPMAGLIALSGAQEGDIGQSLLSNNADQAEELARAYQEWFPDGFYLELQRTGQPFQEDYNHAAVVLAQRLSLPVVATNNVVFLEQTDFDAHEVRVCIQDGRVLTDTRRPRRYTPLQYFRNTSEMTELFADIPEAIENTAEIARRCNLRFKFGRYYLPAYPVPEDMTIDDLLREHSRAGLEARLRLIPDDRRENSRNAYLERLELELSTIIKMGFPGYFLIVADFIQWAKQNGIPVGPGRGSGSGSLVAYCLGITELDPIKYDLLFERFLNPERVSLPDFDVDFCMERRDEVIDYVTRRYGADRVAQIITHGTMAAKAVVRDVGRVMDHPYAYVDKLAKLIPFEIGMTLERALEIEPQLAERYKKEEDVRDLLDTARTLEGMARSAGKHAGGVVIAPGPLTDFMPLYCEQGGKQTVTGLDMEDVEKIGLVKFDFLGLRTLTIIDKAVKNINAERDSQGELPIVIEQLAIDDPVTYALIKSARTTALFQLESRGMKDLIQRLQPDNFEEIVALVALFRPGPLQSGMVDDFINRKHKRTAIKYLHPSLEPILKPTFGVILYQEQVMQIAQVLSGYTLGSADLLRRAMGKKKPEEMAQQREGFVQGATARGVSDKLATHIFDVIEKFAGYGFNRSHSAAYALIAYQTAWLKAHYPAEFMAAVLSSDMDKTDKVVTMIAECRDMHINLRPPDVNQCEYHFVPVDRETILYGLGAIKGLGEAAIDAILQERCREGAFKDLFDFCQRIDLRKVNRRVLESLIKAGALDALGTHRAGLINSLNAALAAADQHTRNRDAGQGDIFGAAAAPEEAQGYETVAEWSDDQRLEGEKETLGLYLTGHPIARYAEELKHITDATIAELKPSSDSTVVVAGLVVAQRTMQTRRGDRMAFVTLDDRTGRLELAVFSDLYAQSRELLAKDTLLVVEGQVSVDEYTGGFKMSAEKLYNIDQARSAFSARLVIDVDAEQAGNGFVEELKEILTPATQGRCPVYLRYQGRLAEAEIVLGDEWRISPTNSLLERLSRLAGESHVRLIYR
ncbi:MAG: DNA polymerase III subunit alpha [Gammaproteobacteria bacterium]|nr:DNA polymerase III subunit alpha [Gammaproteobacteria bacterium]MDH3405466.1 DNA polymerase III subunit alpha [Gammaproteobacteria bacterium]MDH5486044.1 DNA polymerase III subunit alpha [Gammaproteobacteria bacterium]